MCCFNLSGTALRDSICMSRCCDCSNCWAGSSCVSALRMSTQPGSPLSYAASFLTSRSSTVAAMMWLLCQAHTLPEHGRQPDTYFGFQTHSSFPAHVNLDAPHHTMCIGPLQSGTWRFGPKAGMNASARLAGSGCRSCDLKMQLCLQVNHSSSMLKHHICTQSLRLLMYSIIHI